ncbi:hypothetical protein VB738_11790 [Cyanobium gracile UHCC 0139]|uniref:Uncharacterized protein n=1 Tax=Cyanobium gracile UHCC 0139 TaxID=3110308 RepID=A0ABU5RVY7_9CYAN|nr:hypothetical protein [Cyanobium gracile]MEA5391937.1 hypothetical protein [Cyanobium gracile UHCC 0139]
MHDQELVSADLGHDVRGSHEAAQPIDHDLHQLIPLGRAEAFLDALDAVQFDPDHHQGLGLLAQLTQTQFGHLQVGQSGQGVVEAEILELPVLLPKHGHIGEGGDVVAGVTGAVSHHPHPHPGGIDLTGASSVPDLPFPAVVGEQVLPQGGIEPCRLVAGVHDPGIASDQLLLRVAGDGDVGLVAGQDRPAAVGDHEPFLDQGAGPAMEAEPLEALLQLAPQLPQAAALLFGQTAPPLQLPAQQGGQQAGGQTQQQHRPPGGQPGGGVMQGVHQQQPPLAPDVESVGAGMGQDAGRREVAGVVEELGGVGAIAEVQLQVHGLVHPNQRVVQGRPHDIPKRQDGEGPARGSW